MTLSSATSAFVDHLRDVVGSDNVLTDPSDRWTYGYDNSRTHSQPDAVVFAADADQIKRILTACNQSGVPLVARGRGTGTTGGAVPVDGGVVLSLERMQNILAINPADRTIIVEPGVINRSVQESAAAHGLFWPPDPSSADYCTVGGNLAFNAAGPRAVKYGTVRENVLGLKAITGAGDVIHTGVSTTKGVVGYDLTRLIIGSEGTLAIITEAVLKLSPLPESVRTLRAVYQDIRSAANAVVRVMGQPAVPCALEFMDGHAVALVRELAPAVLPADAGALLMIEVDGAEADIDGTLAKVEQAARGEGLVSLARADTDTERDALWATRKALSPALRKVAPNKLNEDVVVPVSRIPDLVDGLDKLSQEFGIPIVNFGHAGNGNIHVNLLYDNQDEKQQKNARPCLDRVFDLVLKLNGTLSGEHGVGTEKRDYINREIDPATLDLMRRIKQQFDPAGILNPGKMFPGDA